MSSNHDLLRTLISARDWTLAGERGRGIAIDIDESRVRCQLWECGQGCARYVLGSGESGEHYRDIRAEIAHAIETAMGEAENRRASGKEESER